jgi:hypothetical protein
MITRIHIVHIVLCNRKFARKKTSVLQGSDEWTTVRVPDKNEAESLGKLPAGYTSSLQSNPPTSKYLLYRHRVVRLSLVENCSILHLHTALYFSLRSMVTPLSQSSPLESGLEEIVAGCISTMPTPLTRPSLSDNLKATFSELYAHQAIPRYTPL